VFPILLSHDQGDVFSGICIWLHNCNRQQYIYIYILVCKLWWIQIYLLLFLSVFAKLRKGTTSWFKYDRDWFVCKSGDISPGHIWTTLYEIRRASLSVYPSVRMEQIGSKWADFHEILYLNSFRKSAVKTQVSLKSSNNNVKTYVHL